MDEQDETGQAKEEVVELLLTTASTSSDETHDSNSSEVDVKPSVVEAESLTVPIMPTTTTMNVNVAAVMLADGTTALIQQGQEVELENGTMAIIQAVSDKTHGLQEVLLEDGRTAYITLTPDGMFDSDSISLEGFGQHLTEKDELGERVRNPCQDLLQAAGVSAARLSSARAMALGDKAFHCLFEGCGRLYTTQHHLKVHERSHTGDRPFRCEEPGCSKAFATGYGLKSHTRVHTGEKPYKCPKENCDKAFKTSGDLQKHVRTHTGERPFKCPFDSCDRSFTTSNIRKVHIRTHTGERPYICTEEGCLRSFASATNFKNHIRIHTGEKPYVCTVQGCGKRFTEYSSLYKHHVVHTHTKPYTCNMCGKTYRQTSTLAMHRRTSHGIIDVGDDDNEGLVGEEEEEEEDIEDGELMLTPAKRLCTNRVGKMSNNSRNITANLVIQGAGGEEQQVMVATAAGLANNSALAAFQVAQKAVNEHGLSQHQFAIHGATASGSHILVVADPAQLAALQQHLANAGPLIPHTLSLDAIESATSDSVTAPVATATSVDDGDNDGTMITFSAE